MSPFFRCHCWALCTLAYALASGLLVSCGQRPETTTAHSGPPASASGPPLAVSTSVPPLVDSVTADNASDGVGVSKRPGDVLGKIPPDEVRPALPTKILFRIGEEVHTADELAEIAMAAAIKQGGTVSPEDLRIYVTIIAFDEGGVLADVVISHGIGKPSWSVTIGRKMQVISCRKSIGRG